MPQLDLIRLRFSLCVTAAISLPPYKGDMLRRALLWNLGTIWCRQPQRCRDGCRSLHECLFGSLIEPPSNPAWSEQIRRLMGPTPPPAYVLWDNQDRRRQLAANDPFHFELVLIGQAAIRQLPAFIAAFMAAAEQGIGLERLRVKLQRVDLLVGSDSQARPLMINGAWQGDPAQDVTLGYDDGQRWTEQLTASLAAPVTRLRIHFLSPTKIEAKGEQVREPQFSPLARAIVRRLRILSQVHGAGEWPQSEYGPLLDLADQVQLEHHETTWISMSRHSERGEMPLEGFVGQAWYASPVDLRPLLPALWLGQWVHVGKAAVWGNGRYEIEMNRII